MQIAKLDQGSCTLMRTDSTPYCYLRLVTDKGASVWYVATMTGFELLPSAEANALEQLFQEAQA